VLHTALPQVFAGLPGRGLEPVRTLLVIFITNSQHEVFSFEVDLADSRPKVVSDFVPVSENDDTAGGQPEVVFDIVLPNDGMEVYSIHVQPFHFLQVSIFCLRGLEARQSTVCLLYSCLYLF